MPYEVFLTPLSGVVLLRPRIFRDDRGFFYESFNARDFAAATGLDAAFVQDNHSRSVRGVLRGLHYQLPPAAQGKLVRVIFGEIFDVALDIRGGSPTCGHWFGQRLSAENGLQMWIPQGFAHGFQAVSETAEVLYKTTDFYNPQCERSLVWNDPEVRIDWPLSGSPLLSDKDAAAPRFADAERWPEGC